MNATTFNDIFKKSFLETLAEVDLSALDMISTLAVALGIGLIIYLIYRWTFQGVVYSPSFNMTLLGMTIITSVIIKTISSNVVLSLGMVGALSIVRFRAAIKDPKDIMYLFLAITMGITIGAGLYLISIISTVFIGIVFLIFARVKIKRRNYLMVLRYNIQAQKNVMAGLNHIRYSEKSRIMSYGTIELTVEVELSKRLDQGGFINMFNEIEGVEHVTLVHYAGDFTE